MQFKTFAPLLAAATAAQATSILVASYDGAVTTFELTEKNGNFTLEETSVSNDCAPSPSWLTIDASRGEVYCLNEGLETLNGSISSFTVSRDGSLTHVQNTTVISGPVSGVFYGEPAGKRGLVVAHYSGSAVSSWDLLGGAKFSLNQNLPYTLAKPGVVPSRQEAPHEHEAITDPTGQYVVVPDLGADLVRIYSWDEETLDLKALSPLKATPGTGPRHAVFWNPYGVACEGCTTYFYLVGELAADVTGYKVTYKRNGGGLSFKKIYHSSTYGYFNAPESNAPAEIVISPDNRFLTISNRNDSSFSVPNINPSNSTAEVSDAISTFKLNQDGTLTFSQLAPAYGPFPRHISYNAIGDLVGVGLQNSNEVAILKRDTLTGNIGEAVARAQLGGMVTNVVFLEEKALGGKLGG
ncbi:putative isomerase YbhE [Polychaeton citri CBS 116435]|uniref:Isomerase YbhE n=1 Tax=Polychaeton citri CBS 116435 TaxID=1314669 RepID=A0A9P4UPD7_9PEZI|nr:putative isomerase YbhE [Polychaeton citri CBS 116435]